MPTRLFPGRSDSDEQEDDFDTESGPQDASRSELMAFSDLSRAAIVEFRVRWSALTGTEREQLMHSLIELAEQSVDFNFQRVFREVLDDEDPRVRLLAIEGLWEDDDSGLPATYFGMLRTDPDADVRAAAATALQRHLEQFPSDRRNELNGLLIETMVAFGSDPGQNSLVRRRCIETAGVFAQDDRVVRLIRESFADDDQTLAAGALRAMGLSRQPRWIPEIERALASPDAEMRFEAAGAAGLLGESDLVESLAKVVDDEDAEVQAAALGALGKIGGPGALRVLRRLREARLIDDDEMIDDALEEAMLTEDPLASS